MRPPGSWGWGVSGVDATEGHGYAQQYGRAQAGSCGHNPIHNLHRDKGFCCHNGATPDLARSRESNAIADADYVESFFWATQIQCHKFIAFIIAGGNLRKNAC
jgi:hypothetical protein